MGLAQNAMSKIAFLNLNVFYKRLFFHSFLSQREMHESSSCMPQIFMAYSVCPNWQSMPQSFEYLWHTRVWLVCLSENGRNEKIMSSITSTCSLNWHSYSTTIKKHHCEMICALIIDAQFPRFIYLSIFIYYLNTQTAAEILNHLYMRIVCQFVQYQYFTVAPLSGQIIVDRAANQNFRFDNPANNMGNFPKKSFQIWPNLSHKFNFGQYWVNKPLFWGSPID